MEDILKELKFDINGLMPVIAQDHTTGEVLMLAYMNREALDKTLETGKMHYWSRSRQKLWLKGETSGHYQYVKAIAVDCDADTLLAKVEQKEAACHTGQYSCFFREIDKNGIREIQKSGACTVNTCIDKAGILKELYDVIQDRRVNPKEGSYTNYLFGKGIDKILKKVGEETAEVIIAAKNNSKAEIRYETADLLYHLMVMLVERGLVLDEVYDELMGRR
jgi:phosphoribosyl-ATP pyrophosphohydrolase/phosphoribosyl-AMP cyclohydrolase